MINQKSLENFQKGSIVLLDGNFSEHKNSIKAKLKTLGMEVKTKFDPSVTHLIVGQNPQDAWRLIKEHGLDYLLENQLYPILKTVEEGNQFLVQAEESGETALAENLKALLGSPDAATVKVALQMLKTGGLPAPLLEEMLVLCKVFPDLDVRNEAKKLLITQGPSEWIALVKDSQIFANIATSKEKDIRAKMVKTSQNVGMVLTSTLGLAFFKRYRKGLAFTLSFNGSPQRIEALYALTDGETLDFHAGIGYHNWKEDKPEEVILSKVATGISFPKDYPNPLAIRHLNFHNCKFDKLSPDIAAFAFAESLDLSVNNLATVHPAIAKLSQLRKVDLSHNRLTAFPDILLKMPKLEEVDLRYNGQYAFKVMENNPFNVPAAFYEKNPNCTVLI